VLGLPSLVLYSTEVVIILRNRKLFDTAFYRLFLTRAVIHIVGYFNSYVGLRFGRLGLFYSVYTWVGSFPIAVDWFLF
jgi:Serpentine type 7TM GPCR chemoreceptor Srv